MDRSSILGRSMKPAANAIWSHPRRQPTQHTIGLVGRIVGALRAMPTAPLDQAEDLLRLFNARMPHLKRPSTPPATVPHDTAPLSVDQDHFHLREHLPKGILDRLSVFPISRLRSLKRGSIGSWKGGVMYKSHHVVLRQVNLAHASPMQVSNSLQMQRRL